MSIKEWFKNQAAALTIALSNVEKNALSQDGVSLEKNINQEKRHSEGTLADDLVQGKLTQQVMDLRWRTFKILDHAQHFAVRLDKEGNPYMIDKSGTNVLANVKVDSFDDYPIEMVVKNDHITTSINDTLNTLNLDGDGLIKGTSLVNLFAGKTNKPVKVIRDFVSKFDIENYTKKLNVRQIDGERKLLEFYVSKYEDEYNINSKHFINQIKKTMEMGSKGMDYLLIKEVGFVTQHTLGADDFLAFGYEIINFDKIVEFDGYYVVKFIGRVVVNGEYIMEKFRVKELDTKYKKKEVKKRKI